MGGPVEEVGDQEEGHNLEVEGLGAEVPLVAGQTDQETERGEEACHHDLEDQQEVEEGLGQEVEDLEGQGAQEDPEGDVGDLAFHLKKIKHKKDKTNMLMNRNVYSTLLALRHFKTEHVPHNPSVGCAA